MRKTLSLFDMNTKGAAPHQGWPLSRYKNKAGTPTGGGGGGEAKNTMLEDHTTHPLWETQVSLERGMTLEGARRVQDAIATASAKGQRSKLQPYQDLMQAWLPKIGIAIQDWLTAQRRSRSNNKPVAFPLLDGADPMVAGLLALRTILDRLSQPRAGGRAISTQALSLGSTLEHEFMIRAWEKNAPGLYHDRKNRLKAQGADAGHTRRVNIHEFNRLMDEGKFGFEWRAWTNDEKIAVGAVLLNCVMVATGWFESRRDEDTEGKSATLSLHFKPGMEEWVTVRLSKLEEMSPALKPTVMPPKPWSGTQDGGYWTPYVHGPHLIRFKASQVDQRFNAKMEYDALEMPRVYQALHFLQNTPWRINARVHAIMTEAITRGKTWADLPDYRGKDAPPKPVITELMSPEERKAWRQSDEGRAWRGEASQVAAYNAKLGSQRRQVSRILQVVDEYKGFERFYFPYMLDWRGRMYPIPLFLQPQGNDVARGLLEFSEGKRVTQANGGERWLAINIASAWGNDKVSFDDRVAWVKDNGQLWERIAADPIGCAEEWVGCDKPWQALAAIFDLIGYRDACISGKPYQSHAVVSVDGTCNGLQHLSAMSGDAVIGAHVNLVPGAEPQDVYQHVADAMLPLLKQRANARNKEGAAAKYWLSKVGPDGKLSRSLVKRPVMILAYSATKTSFYEYTREWLNENDPSPPRTGDAKLDEKMRDERSDRVKLIVDMLWDTIQLNLPRQMKVMQWLQDCAKLASTGNQPIYWTTPDGFVVRHFYGKVRPYLIRVKLDGSTFDLRLYEHTKELDGLKQRLGIAPNFVHSLDAAAARGCINRAEEEGHITAFCAIHDSFGTHAADMERLYGYLREAFVEVHQVGVLKAFRNACLGVMVAEMIPRLGLDPLEASQIADEKLPKVPDIGDLDLEGVLCSDYFFA